MIDKTSQWCFINDSGAFEWKNPHTINELYFPICNEAGMMSSITPKLNGDSKTGQNSFVTLPITMEDLHNTRSARNFWIFSERTGAYSLTGNSAKQLAETFTDNTCVTVKGEFLAHTLVREDEKYGIKSEITNFCPVTDDTVEIMHVKITNIGKENLTFTPTSAIPLYGRSADNLRDHRHCTSLMHRMKLYDFGVSVKPTIHHDERGHEPNYTYYFVVGADGEGNPPIGQFPTVREFIGDGGTLDCPEAVIKNLKPQIADKARADGMESVGALRFADVTLKSGEKQEYIIVFGATDDENTIRRCVERYAGSEKASLARKENNAFWQKKVDAVNFDSGNRKFDLWMKWVALQPELRKIYGCSFMPHHDYGRGGRGWRDLWQDYLALLLQNPDEVRDILIANFGGVRLDGSNATIILKGIGKFAADRNKISRVWMDHGVWPYFTTKLYVEQTGDAEIFFEKNSYWKDHQMRRAKAKDSSWTPDYGNRQRTATGEIYEGTLFEKALLQHLVCFYNVGEHGNMKLEDADWNDQLDLAPDRGESIPFTAFYAYNLVSMSEFLSGYAAQTGKKNIKVFKELDILIHAQCDTPAKKQETLKEYFDAIDGFTGEQIDIEIKDLAANLKEKGEKLLKHVRENEWLKTKAGYGYFNGYYNNDGVRVDGDREDCTAMNLTAQTFAIMSGAATDEQVKSIYKAAQAILKDPNTGGYRLTTPLGKNTWNFGRGFALKYGEKETGGMFSHMAVMFCNALYSRGFVKEGYEVLTNIYRLCTNTVKAKIYPGVPEYVSSEGQGKYHYVTGSASWLLMTVLTQIYGVRGCCGDLVLDPKLTLEQFDENKAVSVFTRFAGENFKVEYFNPQSKQYGCYSVKEVKINGKLFDAENFGKGVRIKKESLKGVKEIKVLLG